MEDQQKSNDNYSPSADDIKQFEILSPMLLADLKVLKQFSKMKQDGIVNSLKVKAINKKLTRLKDLLLQEPTAEYLDKLDTDILPSNSDAVYVLLQYKEAMAQYKGKFFTKDNSDFDVADENYSWKTAK